MFADYSALAKVPRCMVLFSKREAKRYWRNPDRIGVGSRFTIAVSIYFFLCYKERLLTPDFFSSRYLS